MLIFKDCRILINYSIFFALTSKYSLPYLVIYFAVVSMHCELELFWQENQLGSIHIATKQMLNNHFVNAITEVKFGKQHFESTNYPGSIFAGKVTGISDRDFLRQTVKYRNCERLKRKIEIFLKVFFFIYVSNQVFLNIITSRISKLIIS